MIPYDMKNYRANDPGLLRKITPKIIAIIALIAVLGWTGERDHQARLEQVRIASINQCNQ